nr:immunoglobulin heavy chain junction region [Macaca mulatta]MOY22974.1 immunoglobulin heavy chain junction region [Macaca mulatta]MOY26979.1 immunoglobulin heavy chain junction region [Macaca mulatta]MOY28806.1 immunoglobulin heavy chain junction region [Macaca mulatta]
CARYCSGIYCQILGFDYW